MISVMPVPLLLVHPRNIANKVIFEMYPLFAITVGNLIAILSIRNLFFKNQIVYFFRSKLTDLFLFSFLIHPVEPPVL